MSHPFGTFGTSHWCFWHFWHSLLFRKLARKRTFGTFELYVPLNDLKTLLLLLLKKYLNGNFLKEWKCQKVQKESSGKQRKAGRTASPTATSPALVLVGISGDFALWMGSPTGRLYRSHTYAAFPSFVADFYLSQRTKKLPARRPVPTLSESLPVPGAVGAV